jgi:hypothetical protein
VACQAEVGRVTPCAPRNTDGVQRTARPTARGPWHGACWADSSCQIYANVCNAR